MGIGKAWRIGGFVTALAASGALIASATGATGAYFTDAHGGTLQATSGHLHLNTGDTTLNFTGLVPGVDQTKTIGYNTDTNVNEDVWLVFPTDTAVEQEAYAEFTGYKGQFGYADGGLGRYGHFAVSDTNGGQAFQSYNLQNDPDGPQAGDCPVNAANGRGGSSQQATSVDDTPPYCGVPTAILLASNLGNGATGTITVTFGLTGRQTAQNQVEFPQAPLQFQIVATQHGIRPDAPNF